MARTEIKKGREHLPRTAIISIYRPDVAVGDEDNPFAGIEIVAVEEATGGDYEDIIAPLRKQHPDAQFRIEEIQL